VAGIQAGSLLRPCAFSRWADLDFAALERKSMVVELDLATPELKSKTVEFDLVRPSRGVNALDVRVRSAARGHAGMWASPAVESSSAVLNRHHKRRRRSWRCSGSTRSRRRCVEARPQWLDVRAAAQWTELRGIGGGRGWSESREHSAVEEQQQVAEVQRVRRSQQLEVRRTLRGG
jgi:hypothetical protein